MFNDNLILDCCMYFSRERQSFLCSADHNLCIISHAQGEKRSWLIYEDFNNMQEFQRFRQHDTGAAKIFLVSFTETKWT
jgi:hypothetical protein